MKQGGIQDQPDALSPEETAALLTMSDSFIQEAVHMSRHYAGCSRHPSAIDPTRWKRIAHVRDLAMYKERRARWRLGSKRKLGSRLANKEYVDDSTKLLPATLMIGTFPGALESVMFGLQSSTEDATRLRASYLGDNLVDEKLLAVPLESPSYDNPLRSCTLRWRGLRSGTAAAKVASGKIFSSRAIETVYIESTGITELGNGERVGYELLQSVEVPGLDGFSKNGRRQAIISYCYVYRQPSPDVMEVFMLGSTSRDGVLLGGALAKMHSLHRLVRCAERKKLAWLLNSSQPTLANPKAGGSCAECFRSFGRWPHRAERQCSACDERVCASCTAYRQMRFALPFRRKVTRSKLAFCGRCLQRAEETSPLTVAAFEAMEQGEDFDFDTFDSSMPPLSHPLKWSSQCLDVDDDLAMTILGD
ncbi:hypothetical protein PC129_g14231 [Phytophthora cactorum]|uniref:FYVE-type domain-containing protein n=1 Tax=Phytophthora cactorum TaxID=29920 RepID=A0A329RTQ2_9STRA|nr:hypothetical protein Pcac1_g18895 [Phytophthora cactorum]KAG2817161.1 hypothetical protein PC111_g12811 [Phytophthora cactorum]KAG2822342.1 hypothetical protein PC112_g10993 [Phytophthora cactorum]KAG2856566.1 hypothetical protein PC113_g11470 [Phytophthora cactorum]KAG2896586.1 hypothetical protein PC114_g15039 [Phytophthora cactorum]